MQIFSKLAILACVFLGLHAMGQAQSPGVNTQPVHASTLGNTATSENPERQVSVYLPPSYATKPQRRYPTLYLLHGLGDTQQVWINPWFDANDPWGTVDRIMDEGVASGRLEEMIIVMPDMRSRAGGSFYVNSSATGNWEDFLARELVSWVDSTFRTLNAADSRGIAGHSMGGYGAMSIGMKYQDVFSAVYGMSSAAIDWGADLAADNPTFRSILSIPDWDEVDEVYEMGIMIAAQAFSPAPDSPPFYADMPFRIGKNGQMEPSEPAFSNWTGRLIVNQVTRYRDNLRSLRGFKFDAGTDDEFTHIPLGSRRLSERLRELNVHHIFEEYNGGHRDRLWGRSGRIRTEVLPWFSMLLQRTPVRENH